MCDTKVRTRVQRYITILDDKLSPFIIAMKFLYLIPDVIHLQDAYLYKEECNIYP